MGSDDAVSGCVRWLRTDPGLCTLIAPGYDQQPLIVQDQVPERAEFAQGVCLVVSHAGPAAGNDHNTYEQIRLQIELWSDPLRDAAAMIDEAPAGARQRMVRAYGALDRRLHRPQGGPQLWGDVLTTDATRLAGLTPYLVPGSDGLWRGTAFYAVGLA